MTARTAIIIGGGIAGCSTAYALAQRGIQVTQLERNGEIANAASGNPLAMLYPRLSGNDASSEFALAAYQHSLGLYKSLGLSPKDFDCCGLLQLGFNVKESARIQKVAAQGHSGNILEYVNKAQASQLAGIPIEHDALHFPDAAWINPRSLCKRLTQHNNISTLTHENALDILQVNNCFEVRTNNSVLKSDIVVIANANDAQQLYSSLPMSIQAVRGQVSMVKSTDSSKGMQKIVCSDGYLSPAALWANSDQRNTAPMHCLGATFANITAPESTRNEMMIEKQDHQANLEKLNNISSTAYTDLKNNIVGGRVSLRCTASDYWPLAGLLLDVATLKATPPRPGADVNTLPWLNGLYMNIAHGSKGFITAPLCAELIACMASDQAKPVSEELAGLMNPNRFLLKAMGLKRLAKMIPVLAST